MNESLLCLSIKKVSHPPLQSSTDWRAKIQCLALLILGIWNKFMFPCDKRSRGLVQNDGTQACSESLEGLISSEACNPIPMF